MLTEVSKTSNVSEHATVSPLPVSGERVRVRGSFERQRKLLPFTPTLSPCMGGGGRTAFSGMLILEAGTRATSLQGIA
jgi:hypothetical protein